MHGDIQVAHVHTRISQASALNAYYSDVHKYRLCGQTSINIDMNIRVKYYHRITSK